MPRTIEVRGTFMIRQSLLDGFIPRIFLILARLIFASIRLALAALLGLVARRGFGGVSALRINAIKRSVASRRFCSCVR